MPRHPAVDITAADIDALAAWRGILPGESKPVRLLEIKSRKMHRAAFGDASKDAGLNSPNFGSDRPLFVLETENGTPRGAIQFFEGDNGVFQFDVFPSFNSTEASSHPLLTAIKNSPDLASFLLPKMDQAFVTSFERAVHALGHSDYFESRVNQFMAHAEIAAALPAWSTKLAEHGVDLANQLGEGFSVIFDPDTDYSKNVRERKEGFASLFNPLFTGEALSGLGTKVALELGKKIIAEKNLPVLSGLLVYAVWSENAKLLQSPFLSHGKRETIIQQTLADLDGVAPAAVLKFAGDTVESPHRNVIAGLLRDRIQETPPKFTLPETMQLVNSIAAASGARQALSTHVMARLFSSVQASPFEDIDATIAALPSGRPPAYASSGDIAVFLDTIASRFGDERYIKILDKVLERPWLFDSISPHMWNQAMRAVVKTENTKKISDMFSVAAEKNAIALLDRDVINSGFEILATSAPLAEIVEVVKKAKSHAAFEAGVDIRHVFKAAARALVSQEKVGLFSEIMTVKTWATRVGALLSQAARNEGSLMSKPAADDAKPS